MKGYRTLALNIASALVGVLIATDWAGLGLSTTTAGLIISGLGAANTLLRFFTNTSIGQAS